MHTTSDRLAIQANSNIMLQTTFSIQPVGSNGVTVIYSSLPGNNPSQYSDTIMVWQNPNFIPWGSTPIAQVTVPSTNTTPYGSVYVPFTLGVGQSYLIAYCTGSALGNAVTTLWLPAGGNPQPCQAATLGVVVAQTNNVTVSYTLPFGSSPQTYGHWVALWEGAVAPYNTTGIVARTPVGSNNSSDTQNIPLSSPLSANTTYTVAYFAGAGVGTMAAVCTFQTGS